MKDILLLLLQFLTQKPRYRPPILWYENLWFANIFRLYELIFGREFGIRMEGAMYATVKDGKLHIRREFYTLEALVAHSEATIKNYFFFLQTIFCDMPLQYQPVVVSFLILGFTISFHLPMHLLPLFGLSIAYDTSDGSHSGKSSSYSFSYTVTGSSPFIANTVGIDDSGSVLVSSATYNSVSLTNSNQNGTGASSSNKKSAIWYLAAPATGANTFAMSLTASPSNNSCCGVISLSGVAQSSPVDTGAASNAPASSTTASLSATAANTGEWQVSVLSTDTITTPSASTNQNNRWSQTGTSFTHYFGGAAALAGSGSQTVAWTWSTFSMNWAMSMIFVLPYVSVPFKIVNINQAVNRASRY